jgi:hypothetical protein
MDSRTARKLQRLFSDFAKGKIARGADMASWQASGDWRPSNPPPFSSPDLGLRSLAVERPEIAKALKDRELYSTAALMGGLLTLPELQSNSFRLQVLAHLVLISCNGPRRPKLKQVKSWFDALDRATAGDQEDPAEDLFVELVSDKTGNYRLFSGTAEGNAFYVSIFLTLLEKIDIELKSDMKRSAYALLRLSEAIAERSGLPRNVVGNPIPMRRLPEAANQIGADIQRRVTFSGGQLAQIGIGLDDLQPFIFDPSDRHLLPDETMMGTSYERWPLLAVDGGIIASLPGSIGIALRTFIIEHFISTGNQLRFEEALAAAYAEEFRLRPVLGDLPPPPIRFSRFYHNHIAELRIEIDEGRPLQLLFVADGLDGYDKGGFLSVAKDLSLTSALSQSIRSAQDAARNDFNFKEGLTLVVACGWGRSGLYLPSSEMDNWQVEGITAHDLKTFGNAKGGDSQNLNWLLTAERKLVQSEIRLFNVNGLLNLYAWAWKNDGHLVPHERLGENFISHDGGGSLQVPINSFLELRYTVANGRDEHFAISVTGDLIKVRRRYSSPAYGAIGLKPFYVSDRYPFSREALGVYLSNQGNWWIRATSPHASPRFSYELGQVSFLWAERVAAELTALGIQRRNAFEWQVRFSETADSLDSGKKPSQAARLFEMASSPSSGVAEIVVADGFAWAGAIPTNDVEREFARTLLISGLQMLTLELSAGEIDQIMRRVVPTDGARQLHGFTKPDERDFVRESLPRPRTIGRFPDATARIGLGWLSRSRSEGDLEGDDCVSYLNLVVRSVIERMKVALSKLDRTSLTKLALLCHEAASAEERRFRRSFRSMTALADDSDKAGADVSEEIAKLNGASLASRIVAEMALCSAPLHGGQLPGQIDLSALMADAAILFHFGGFSDAMRFGAMRKAIRISPAGDVLMDHSFSDETVTPFGRTFQSARLSAAANNYHANFISDVLSNGEREEEAASDKEFESAWQKEYLFAYEHLREIIRVFHEYAVEGHAIKTMPQEVLLTDLSKCEGVDSEFAAKFLNAFTLRPRPNWETVPAGFQAHAWQPWRFRRQLSLVSRPIIEIDEGASVIVFAPAMVVETLVKFVGDVYQGLFDDDFFSSVEMKSWIGRTNDRRGHRFNESVADLLKKTGWNAIPNIRISAITKIAYSADMGDVDVLAWRQDDDRVLVVECKDLFADKTLGEIARRLSKYRGQIDDRGRPDNLEKHRRRIIALENSIDAVVGFTGKSALRLQPALIFDQPTPIQFHKNSNLDGYLLLTKEQLLNL